MTAFLSLKFKYVEAQVKLSDVWVTFLKWSLVCQKCISEFYLDRGFVEPWGFFLLSFLVAVQTMVNLLKIH